MRKTRVGKVPLGGSITWALEQDPGHIAPFGGILTANHWGNELMYDSLLEWDPKLNIRNALIESYKVVNSKQIVFNLKKGVKFSNGQEVTAADAKYSFDLQANPPLPGSVAVLGQFPAIASTKAVGKYKLQVNLKRPDARIYGYLAWGRYSAIVPNGMYQQLDPSVNGIGTGPFKLAAPYAAERPRSSSSRTRTSGGTASPTSTRSRSRSSPTSRPASRRCAPARSRARRSAADSAAALNGANGLNVLRGLTADFRELQMTLKPGENKPWAKTSGPAGGQPRDQPPEHHRQGLQRLRPVLGPRRFWLRSVAAVEGRADDEVREVRPADGEEPDEVGRRRPAST